MINQSSIKAISQSKFSTEFIHPLYGSYCFSEIPDLIKNTLGIEDKKCGMPEDVFGSLPRNYEKVILFILDAFGWRFLERYGERFPFLQRILKEGSLSKLTSQFPTTTACHMTTIHTGLPVSKSGVFEWFYYEPQVDEVIAPLLFSFARDSERNTLAKAGYFPETFFPSQTIYNDLGARGIPSYIFQHEDYAFSPFSNVVYRGAMVNPYNKFSKGLGHLGDVAQNVKGKAYFFIYYDAFDTACHVHGPNSAILDREASRIFTALENHFFQRFYGKLGNALFMFTADHGQVQINPATTRYLNREIPGVERYFKKNSQGNPIVPAGSPRDMFLYCKDECLAEAKAVIEAHYKGIAEVYETDDLIRRKLFGSDPLSPSLLSRLGNLVILPYAGESVWWHEKDRFEVHFHGHHGGLTPEEVEIPLLLLPL